MLAVAEEEELYPSCTHKMSSFRIQSALTDNSSLQQNYCSCFLAAKVGPGVYSNRYL